MTSPPHTVEPTRHGGTARVAGAAPLAVLVAVLVLSSCSALQLDRGVQVEASMRGLGDAAARTIEAPTGAYQAIYTYSATPASTPALAALNGTEVVVDGRYDRASGLRWAKLDPDSATGVGAGEVGDVVAVTDAAEGVLHVQLERNGPWVLIPFAQAPPTPGGLRHATVDVLALLAVAAGGEGEVRSAGRSDLGGVDTAQLEVSKPLGSGVRGDDDLRALQSVLGIAELGPLLETTARYSVFVDADNTVRRLIVFFDLTPGVVAGGEPAEQVELRVQVDFAELGSSPPVTLPEDEPESG